MRWKAWRGARFAATGSASACSIRLRVPVRDASSRRSTAAAVKAGSPNTSLPTSRFAMSARSSTRLDPVFGRPSTLKATRSRLRTSGTGRTPRSRLTRHRLPLPFPVEVREGAEIRQAVTLRVEREVGGNGTRRGCTLHRLFARQAARQSSGCPGLRIGLGIASHGQPLAPHEVERVRAWGFDHLRVDLDFRVSDWRQTLAACCGRRPGH